MFHFRVLQLYPHTHTSPLQMTTTQNQGIQTAFPHLRFTTNNSRTIILVSLFPQNKHSVQTMYNMEMPQQCVCHYYPFNEFKGTTNHHNLQGVGPWWRYWAQCAVLRFLLELPALHLPHLHHQQIDRTWLALVCMMMLNPITFLLLISKSFNQKHHKKVHSHLNPKPLTHKERT